MRVKQFQKLKHQIKYIDSIKYLKIKLFLKNNFIFKK